MNAVDENADELKKRNYVLMPGANSAYWFSYYVRKMNAYTSEHGEDFFLILRGDKEKDDDYYVMPYGEVKRAFTPESTTREKGEKSGLRWTGHIKGGKLHVSLSGIEIDVEKYHGDRQLFAQAMGDGVVRESVLSQINPDLADVTPYDPGDMNDARTKTAKVIAERRGRQRFREELLKAYGGRCAITGCDVLDVLEAAHVTPYRGPRTNHITNGLLLRADLHTLLDCGKLVIDPVTRQVLLAPSVCQTADYKAFHKQQVRPPSHKRQSLSEKVLKQAAQTCRWLSQTE